MLTLRVTSPDGGLDLVLPEGRHLIGAHPKCALYVPRFCDAEVAAITVDPEGEAEVVFAVAGGALDGRPMAPGAVHRLHAGARLAFGNVDFSIVDDRSRTHRRPNPPGDLANSGADPDADRRHRSSGRIATLLVGLAAAAVYFLWPAGGPPADPSARSASSLSMGAATDPEQTARDLGTELQLANLAFPASVAVDGGTVTIRGSVSDFDAPLIRSIARRHEETSDIPVVVEIDDMADLRAFVAGVSAGRDPFITGSDGRTYRTGDLVIDGWQIQAIDIAGITFARGTDSRRLPLGGTVR